MSIYTTDQALGWRIIKVPFYESDFKLNVRSGRKERDDPFWESRRMQLSPMTIGFTERDPELAAGVDPLVPPSILNLFLMNITTTIADELVQFNIESSEITLVWNWGDGTIETVTLPLISHVYAKACFNSVGISQGGLVVASSVTSLTGITLNQVNSYFHDEYPNIVTVNLSNQLLTSAANALKSNTVSFNLNTNMINTWPGEGSLFPALTLLDLGNNTIAGIEQDFSSTAMPLLTYLDISKSNFTVTGGVLSINQFSILTYCDISENGSFTSFLLASPFTVMIFFNADNCNFTVFPFTNVNVPVIETITFANNLISGIIDLSAYTSLETINLKNNAGISDIVLGTAAPYIFVDITDNTLSEATLVQALDDVYDNGNGETNGMFFGAGTNAAITLPNQSSISNLESLGWLVVVNTEVFVFEEVAQTLTFPLSIYEEVNQTNVAPVAVYTEV